MAHGKLYRSFIILQEDEKGHSVSKDKPLSGYAKIEVKNDKCKVAFYAQNLKKDYEKCHMILICGKKDSKHNINLGAVNITDQGKAEITVEHMANNIGGTGVNYDKVVGAALAKEMNGKLSFLMCGFLNGEQPNDDWKNYKTIYCKKTEEKMSGEIKKEEKKHENDMKKETKKIDKDEDNVDKEEMKEMEQVKDYADNPCECMDRNLESKFDDYEREIESFRAEEEEEIKLKGSMGEFFGAVTDGFETAKGFDKDIKNTKWYKVPVSNIDDMLNITNYNKYTVIYYPMINYYPYIKTKGYFLVGLKCDDEGNVKYIVYGVPGTKEKGDQPYGGKTGFVTWIEDPNDNNSGYWLMFYDFKNSMIVIPMQ